jgi:hypothetical protein
MSHIIVTVDTTEALQSAIRDAHEHTIIQIKAGQYGSVNIDAKKYLTLQAEDINNRPHVERINIFNSESINLKRLVLGAEDFDINTNAAMGVNASYSNDLLLSELEIRNVRDAVGIRHSNHVEISNNYLHDVERDGLSLLNVHDLLIKDNYMTAFHPNYEKFLYQDWYFDANGTAYLPDKVTQADHADFIQLTHGCTATITGNLLDATGGAWTQGIFIAGERESNHDSIVITDNVIKNGHQIGILVLNQHGITEKNNTLIQIETLGISGLQETHAPQLKVDTSIAHFDDVWVVDNGQRVLLKGESGQVIIPPTSEENVVTIPLEGALGTIHVNYFILEIKTALSHNISIHYETRDGSATAGEDYIATSGTATLLAGETHISIAVDIIGDNIVEADETFSLVATQIQGARLPDNSSELVATHTIIDDDVQLNTTLAQARLVGVSEVDIF